MNRESGIVRGERRADCRGFTLLEVVVAITLLGTVLGVGFELMGVGLRSAKKSGDYTGAVLVARQKLEEILESDLTPRSESGAAGDYLWAAEITQADDGAASAPVRLVALRVKVQRNGSRGGGVELTTLRLAGDAPTLTTAAGGAAGSQAGPRRTGR